VERHWWCGHYHHRWLVEIDQDSRQITFQFKPHNIHSSGKFYFRCLPWQKVREEFKNTSLLWKDQFSAVEKVILDYRDVKNDLILYKEKMRNKQLFRLKWATEPRTSSVPQQKT
jgi:hypothetical protein